MSRNVDPRVRSSAHAAWTLPPFTARLGDPWYTAPTSSFTLTFAAKEAPPLEERVA